MRFEYKQSGIFFAICVAVIGLIYGIVRISQAYDSGYFQNQSVDAVSADSFELLLKRDDIVLLDFRTQDEFNNGHIAGARFIDPDKAVTLNEQLSIMDPRKTYLVYCYGGRRSTEMAQRMQSLGYVKVIVLDGGFAGWQKAGKPFVANE